MSPDVSVIIPHFNRAELLQQTLVSLQRQNLCHWEAIVVDDGSSVEEWDQARQFRDSRVQFLQRTDGTKGPSRCRNIGLQESVGRYVLFVDSDDLVAPWCLEQRVDFMNANPDAKFGVFPVILFDSTPGDLNTLWNTLDGPDDLNRFLRADPPWHTSSPLWRREAIEELGGFNEAVMYGDDSDLHIRALLAEVPYQKLPKALPDTCIRRADDNRITNTQSPRLLESRMVRLEQGSILLQSQGTVQQQMIWEGQYFVEAEFLLFNVQDSAKNQKAALAAWSNRWHPAILKRVVAQVYMSIARRTRHRAYFVLRLARRIAMALLPKSFFPEAGAFENAALPEERFQEIRGRL